MRHWSSLPSILIRPLRYDESGAIQDAFLISRWSRGENATADIEEFFGCLNQAPFIACSPRWAVHPCDPIFKVARVQTILLEQGTKAHTASTLAKSVGWSPAWLSTCFHRHAGIKLEQFMVKIKMCKALWQVLIEDKPIKDIVYDIGYHDPVYFSKFFKRHFGSTASSLRKDFCRY